MAIGQLHSHVSVLETEGLSADDFGKLVLETMETLKAEWQGCAFEDEYSFARAWIGTAIMEVYTALKIRE